jgi:hypothetical protein
MDTRQSVRAGTFYEASASSCRQHARRLLDAAQVPDDLPDRLYGGLVPHAGWMFSGPVAALTIKALTRAAAPEVFVLLGADHVGTVQMGEVYDAGAWQTPLGEVAVAEEVAAAIIQAGDALRANPAAHAMEHSLEVQVPLIQVAATAARIVPIAVPASPLAVEIGQAVGRALAESFPAATILGSTDLTHHGGHFPAPGGHGKQGEQWARHNDRRMLDLIESLDAERIVPEAHSRANACGAGAIAATVAACKARGATRGRCLHYTNSYEIVHSMHPNDPDDTTVGYAAVVFA